MVIIKIWGVNLYQHQLIFGDMMIHEILVLECKNVFIYNIVVIFIVTL